MTDYSVDDLAVFESMPDTATKAEIRAAIEAARQLRAGRCPIYGMHDHVDRMVLCSQQRDHDSRHTFDRTD